MAAESNPGFHREESFGSAMNRHAISFQSGAINSTSEMIPMSNYFGMNSTGDMMFSGSSSNIINNNPVISQAGNPSGSLVLDSVPGLKHDTGLAVEWSVDEQYKLEDGLVKYVFLQEFVVMFMMHCFKIIMYYYLSLVHYMVFNLFCSVPLFLAKLLSFVYLASCSPEYF
jgi:hypothetical protein